MAKKYCVVRTDRMYGTDVAPGLRSLRFYGADGKVAEVENGVIAHLEGLEDGQREVHKAVAATAGADLTECALIAAPEVMYDERLRNLEDFINEAGKAVRGYILHCNDEFSVTAEGFVGGSVPAMGAEVGIGADGKIDAAGTGLGKCSHIETVGRYTYYTILVSKTEA